ncbi:MaoC family dehydratase [Pseudothermotoga sp. U03pept]|uniref:MaoC family dehydratase n=1 Tax=Pseudothermotoga sp. U03pept TaxID=3447012 RepID=UPI003F0493C4
MTFSDLYVGLSHAERFVITEEMVKAFAELTKDKNPIHLDEDYARSTRFGKRICHGMLVASLISKVLGMDFPGPGTVLIKQQLKYRAPVYLGEEVEVKVKVNEVIPDKRRLILDTNVVKSDGVVAIEGLAEVLFEL